MATEDKKITSRSVYRVAEGFSSNLYPYGYECEIKPVDQILQFKGRILAFVTGYTTLEP
jgi:hypothetical protein